MESIEASRQAALARAAARTEDAPESADKPELPAPKPAEDEDTTIFFGAMQGVRQMDTAGGRKVQPVTPAAASGGVADPDAAARKKLKDFVAGKVEFDLSFTTEFICGSIKGLDARRINQLKAGQFSPQGHLDLHGCNMMQAHAALLAFIRDHYLEGSRCVLLIPGRGLNSPEGYGVLREKVQDWLTRDPFKRVVLAFCTAQARHGGAGALYVLLRKFKKSAGKIQWDRYVDDPDM
ncbi:MAG: Smr/MutS family protein [Desulfovibrionaceae bacterium]